MVLPRNLNKVLPLDQSALRPGIDASMLFQVESGITLASLNDLLDRRGLALPNMGGYDGQTFVGAVSTSTHGSGLRFGPLAEMTRSLDIVCAGGSIYRVEPTRGITDPQKYSQKYGGSRTLVQDDDWLRAVVVSMGCMGLIYSVVLEAATSFWLKEVRTFSTWERVQDDLRQGDVLKENDHYELLLNPYQINGTHTCLVTTRNVIPPPDHESHGGHRNFLNELLSSLPFTWRILNIIFDVDFKISPDLLEKTLRSMVEKEYVNKSYKVFNIGAANNITAYSTELGFPMKNGVYMDGITMILALAEKAREVGNLYHSGPIALRFVRGTEIFLSPQYGGNTCMAEIIMVKATAGALDLLDRCENASYCYGARPHWGQINSLSGSNGFVSNLYSKFSDWLRVRRKLDPLGTFSSPFSKRAVLE
jgi:hypothetical protein